MKPYLGLCVLAATVHASVAQLPESSPAFRGGPLHRGVYRVAGERLGGLAWRFPTAGDVISSPIVSGGIVYVGGGDGSLYAIDLASGKLRWRDSLGAAVNGSPAVDGGLVFVTTMTSELVAVDASSGTRRWRFTTAPPKPMPWGHETGAYYASSPAVVGGVVVFGSFDGNVYGLDAKRGTLKWKTATGGQIWASPAIDGDRVVVGSADGFVYCLSRATGQVAWRFATDGASLQSAVFGYDRRTVESSAAIADGVVYVGARDGFLYALDERDGSLRWRFDHKTSWVVTSPAVAAGVVYAGSSDGRFVQAVEASSGNELWRSRTPGIVWSSPAVAGDVVYVGDGVGMLHAFDAKTGAERWVFRSGESVFSSPVIADDLVLFGSADRGVYALRTTNGAAPDRAVLYDSALARQASTDNPALLARFFQSRGYSILDAAGASSFLRDHRTPGRRAVLVVATDVPTDTAALTDFLKSGHKVIWPGFPPGIWPRDSSGRRGGYSTIRWDAPRSFIGVDFRDASFDNHAARPTALGLAFGLDAYRTAWAIDPREATLILAVDDNRRAAAWIREYPGFKGSGFVRAPEASLLSLYLLAEWWPM